MGAFGFRKPSDLPRAIAVFPLTGALLLPRSTLPLNIFEPRYLNMVDDAMVAERLIAMVQAMGGPDPAKPALAQVGCVGRITSFAETDDGRYLITLTGLNRYRMERELETASPYRKVEADFSAFPHDLNAPTSGYEIDRIRLAAGLRRYAEVRGFQVDWDAVEKAPAEMVVNAIAALCPFEPSEKQLLLEASSLDDRCASLIALLELNALGGDGSDKSLQ